jgi:hypothetical protein
MLRRVALVRTDVSEERIASTIMVTRISELGTTLTVTSDWSTLQRNTFLRNVRSYKSHSVTSQNTAFFFSKITLRVFAILISISIIITTTITTAISLYILWMNVVIIFFCNLPNPSSRTMARGLTQPLSQMNIQWSFLVMDRV